MEPQIRTPRQDEAMAIAATERLAITAACDHALGLGDDRRALRLAATVPMGLLAERRALLTRLLVADPDAPPDLRARAWSTLANLASDVGDGDGQAAAAAAAIAAATEAGDEFQLAWARYFLVLGNWAADRIDGLDALVADAVAGFEAIGSAHGVASMHWVASQLEPDTAAATALAQRAVAEFRSLAIPSGLAHALEGQALIALRAGDRDLARADLAEAVTIVSDAGNSGCSAHCVESVAAFAAEDGRFGDARRLVDAAAVLREVSGHGMRVWEREGHRRVVAALAGRDDGPTAPPTELDVSAAAVLALAVLADGAD
jgi:hypothetical protein